MTEAGWYRLGGRSQQKQNSLLMKCLPDPSGHHWTNSAASASEDLFSGTTFCVCKPLNDSNQSRRLPLRVCRTSASVKRHTTRSLGLELYMPSHTSSICTHYYVYELVVVNIRIVDSGCPVEIVSALVGLHHTTFKSYFTTECCVLAIFMANSC